MYYIIHVSRCLIPYGSSLKIIINILSQPRQINFTSCHKLSLRSTALAHGWKTHTHTHVYSFHSYESKKSYYIIIVIIIWSWNILILCRDTVIAFSRNSRNFWRNVILCCRLFIVLLSLRSIFSRWKKKTFRDVKYFFKIKRFTFVSLEKIIFFFLAEV